MPQKSLLLLQRLQSSGGPCFCRRLLAQGQPFASAALWLLHQDLFSARLCKMTYSVATCELRRGHWRTDPPHLTPSRLAPRICCRRSHICTTLLLPLLLQTIIIASVCVPVAFGLGSGCVKNIKKTETEKEGGEAITKRRDYYTAVRCTYASDRNHQP